MSKLDTLRKLIREEVKAAIQEQLAEILKEAITVNSAGRQRVTEASEPKKQTTVPGTLNTATRPVIAPQLQPNNPLNNLLAETARSMTPDDMSTLSFDSTSAMGFGSMMPIREEVPVAQSVNGMLSTARASSNIEMVQINEVPDFTELMSNLRAKGVM